MQLHIMTATLKRMGLLGAMICAIGPMVQAQCPMYDGAEEEAVTEEAPCYVPTPVDASRLPGSATTFIDTYYPECGIAECGADYDNQCYEVSLTDGTEIEFANDGKWCEVEAGHDCCIPVEVLTQLLPEKAAAELSNRGLLQRVEKVKHLDSGNYEVELRGVYFDDYCFTPDGSLLWTC